MYFDDETYRLDPIENPSSSKVLLNVPGMHRGFIGGVDGTRTLLTQVSNVVMA